MHGLALLLSALCATGPTVEEGRALVVAFECARCHEGTGTPQPPPDKQCAGCHLAILDGTRPGPAGALQGWRQRIVHLREVPSLTASSRLDRGWIRGFLLDPVDLRRGLGETMPRLGLTRAQAEAIALYLSPGEPPPTASSPAAPAPGDLARGQALLGSKGCGVCHAFTGAALPPTPPRAPVGVTAAELALGMKLAPDLRFTRARLAPADVGRWLRDPRAVKGDATMPRLPLTDDEVEHLTRALLETPLGPAPRPARPARLPVLTRPVGYDEVDLRVFKKTCWHCHAQASLALGDGGPGNTGGFGFPPRGLDVSSHEALLAGSLDDHGQRRSVFLPLADGTPRLLAHLLARQGEEVGVPVPGVRGMPLGLPALGPEDLQLVESWIAQGRPE